MRTFIIEDDVCWSRSLISIAHDIGIWKKVPIYTFLFHDADYIELFKARFSIKFTFIYKHFHESKTGNIIIVKLFLKIQVLSESTLN